MALLQADWCSNKRRLGCRRDGGGQGKGTGGRGVHETRRGASEDADPADSRSWTASLRNGEEMDFCRGSHRVGGTS